MKRIPGARRRTETFGFLKGRTGCRSKAAGYRSLRSRLLWYGVVELGWKPEGTALAVMEQYLFKSRLYPEDLKYPHQRRKDILKFYHERFRDMGCRGRPDKYRGRLQMLKRLYGTNEWRPIDAKEEWGISWSGGRRIASQAVADGYAEIVRRGVYRFTDLEIEDHHNPSRPRHIVPIVEEKAVASEPHPEDRVRFNDGRLREEPILSNRAIDTMIEDGVWPEEGPEDLFEIVKLKFRAGHRRRRARERKEWRPWTDFKKLIPEKIAEEVEKHRDMSYAFEIPFDANAAVEQAQRLLKASHG